MTSPTRHLPRPRNAPARWLAGALLLLICYGATVEAAHRHGFLPPVPTRTLVEAEEGEGSSNLAPVSHGCLLCQFRSHLSFGLIQVPALAAPQVSSLARSSHTASPILSQFFSPRRGRAPPVTSSI